MIHFFLGFPDLFSFGSLPDLLKCVGIRVLFWCTAGSSTIGMDFIKRGRFLDTLYSKGEVLHLLKLSPASLLAKRIVFACRKTLKWASNTSLLSSYTQTYDVQELTVNVGKEECGRTVGRDVNDCLDGCSDIVCLSGLKV